MIHNNFTPKGRTAARLPWRRSYANHSYHGHCRMGVRSYAVVRARTLYARNLAPIPRTMARPSTASRFANYSRDPTLTITHFSTRANFEFSVNHSYWESRTITSRSGRSWGCTCIHGISSTTRFWTRTIPADLETCNTTPQGEWRTTSTTDGPSPRKSIDGFGPLHGFLPLFEAISRGLGGSGSQHQMAEYRNRDRRGCEPWSRQADAETDAVARPQLNSPHISCRCSRGI